jgi:hypothetical protein
VKRSPLYALLVLSLSSGFASAQEDEWLGDDGRDINLDIHAGVFGDGVNSFTGAFSMPFYKGNRFGLSLTQMQAEPESIQSTNFYAVSDPFKRFTFGIASSNTTQDGAFDASDLELSAGWNFGRWYLEAQYLDGDITLEATDPRFLETTEDPDAEEPAEGEELDEAVVDLVASLLKEAGYLDATRNGFGLALSYHSDNYALRLGYIDYALERELDGSDDALRATFSELDPEDQLAVIQALRNSENRRGQLWRTARILNYTANHLARQAGHLVNNQISIDYARQLSDMDVGLGISMSEELFTEESFNTIYVSADYPVSDSASFGILVSSSDQDASTYAEMKIGYSW